MHLLHFGVNGELILATFHGDIIPPYAILSHTWGAEDDEVTFNEAKVGSGKTKAGYVKIQFCGQQAKKDNLQYFWVDTCCINKQNLVELSEAINSMFRWYHEAAQCYVYLSDVSVRNPRQQACESDSGFRNSRWFTRGWTLQELIAPHSVEFFSREQEYLGNKRMLEQEIHETTGIPIVALHGGAPLSDFSVNERIRWAAKRKTQRKEDMAYCLLGIFEVFMPLIYGEGGDNAFKRLKEEINKRSRKFDEATLKSLSDLQATNPELDMKRIEDSIEPLAPDQDKWIRNDPVIQEWRDSDCSSLLWISGDPGQGKTMLMIGLVHKLLNAPGKSVTYFFCESTDDRLNTADSILRGLIWKLAKDQPQLAELFHREFQSSKHQFNGPNAIYALFSTLSIMLDDNPGTFLLVDALDKCNPGPERECLLQLITKHAKSSSKTKWLLASRSNPDIMQGLRREGRTLNLNKCSIAPPASRRLVSHNKTTSAHTRVTALPDTPSLSFPSPRWLSSSSHNIRSVILKGHSGSVCSLAFSPDGKQLVSGSWDDTIGIWDPDLGGEARYILKGHSHSISAVVFSPDGKQLASGSWDGTIRLWDPTTGVALRTLKGHSGSVYTVAISPDGKRLASGARDNSVKIWEQATGAVQYTLKGHSGWVRAVAFSPDGKQLVSGARDNTVRLWDLTTGVEQYTLNDHSGWVSVASFSPNGKYLASGSWDSTVRLWDPATGTPRYTLKGHSDSVCTIAFSPDSKHLASGSWDGTVRLWDPASGVIVHILKGHSGWVYEIAFSPDSTMLASGSWDNTARIWDTATGTAHQILYDHSDSVRSLAFSPDGKKLASGSRDSTVRLWDLATDALNSRGLVQLVRAAALWLRDLATCAI